VALSMNSTLATPKSYSSRGSTKGKLRDMLAQLI
jgi:hypothetical protein